MASTNKPMPTIGVDKYTYWQVESEDSSGITYGDAKSLLGAVEITPSDSGGVLTFDADNGVYAAMSYIEKIGHDIENADITPEVDAEWRGLTITNGIVEVTNGVSAPYFGCAWRVLKMDGHYRYFRCYKGVYSFASNTGGKTKPGSGAPEPQTAKATYTAMQRDADGAYYAYIDDDNLPDGVTAADVEENWFTDINWVPTA